MGQLVTPAAGISADTLDGVPARSNEPKRPAMSSVRWLHVKPIGFQAPKDLVHLLFGLLNESNVSRLGFTRSHALRGDAVFDAPRRPPSRVTSRSSRGPAPPSSHSSGHWNTSSASGR